MRIRDFFRLITSAGSGWIDDNAMRLSAALAYYSLFSLAPLLIIVISVASLVLGDAAARGQVSAQISQLAGARAADAIQSLVLTTSRKGVTATVISLVLLFFGASSAFIELKDALNSIWGVALKPGRPLLMLVRGRFISFTMVLAVGFLLLVSLAINAGLTAFGASIRGLLALPGTFWQCTDFGISFVVVTILFAMIFKLLPNVNIRWRDVWIGAGGTAFLFTVGKFLIGFYLGTSGVTSYYGAAGSVIVILLWIYFSACILFLGAEFTKAFVLKYGLGIVPDHLAEFRPGSLASTLRGG